MSSKSDRHFRMVIHIALGKWKPSASSEDIQRLLEMLKSMPSQIPEILSYRVGENTSRHSMGFTHAVVATFKDRDSLERYRKHPAHKPVGELWDVLELEGIGVDFESD